MKEFKLRKEESFIKILKEPPLKKKKINFQKWLYIIVLAGIVFYIAIKVYIGIAVVVAEGQIDLPKQVVSFTEDVRLLRMKVEEGSQVMRGDTLFLYSYESHNDRSDIKRTSTTSKMPEWVVREINQAKKKIEMNKISVEYKKNLLSTIKKNIESKKNLLLAGVNEGYNNYKNLQDQSAKIEAEISSLSSEIKYTRIYLQDLLKQKSEVAESATTTITSPVNNRRYFVSPYDGIVGKIFFEENEICYRKDELLTIHRTEDVAISTFFDPDEMQHVRIGDEVVVTFPDGTESMGIINKFHISTYALPSELQKKHEPTERNIVADIVPYNKEEGKEWKNFYKMNVIIKKLRFKL